MGLILNNGLPVDSREKVLAAGLDIGNVGCCAQRDHNTRGCDHWKECIFSRKDFGGFKGTRPHNIGYYRRLNMAEGGASKHDVSSCYHWMASLEPLRRAQRETGEIIQIVAQEGQKLPRTNRVPVDPNNNKTGDIRLKSVPDPDFVVPKHPGVEDFYPTAEFEQAITREFEREEAAEVEARRGRKSVA